MFSPLRARIAIIGTGATPSLISRPLLIQSAARFSISRSSSTAKPPSKTTTLHTGDVIAANEPFPETASGETRGISAHTEALARDTETNATPVEHWGIRGEPIIETAEEAREVLARQAPNRDATWSRSQQVRSEAMKGPRFEQTIMQAQPLPYSAMELIHRQPVRWTHDKIVVCDGEGGSLGHPKIFINTDKPEITYCGYCGNPFANEHHRETIAAGEPTYPLE